MENKQEQVTYSFVQYQAVAEELGIYPNNGTIAKHTLLCTGVEVDGKVLKALDEMEDGNLSYALLGLMGEAGELCNKYKKVLRDNNGIISDEFRADAKKEIGDILWYVSAIASDLNLSLEGIARGNIAKLQSRKERGTLRGSGDNR